MTFKLKYTRPHAEGQTASDEPEFETMEEARSARDALLEKYGRGDYEIFDGEKSIEKLSSW